MTWLRARGLLLPALEEGDEASLVEALRCGLAQLWLGQRSALVTQMTVQREIHVWLAGGDMAEILTLVPGAEAWGRALGCTHVTVDGRAGWARVLKRLGYRPDGAILRKVL